MKNNLFEGENLSPAQIKDNLVGMALGTKEMSFLKQLTKEELDLEKDNLAQVAIRQAALEEEKKAVMDQFNDKAKKLKLHFVETLNAIKTGGTMVEEVVYMVPDYETRMMNMFDENANLVQSRPMTADERQRDLSRDAKMYAMTGTLD